MSCKGADGAVGGVDTEFNGDRTIRGVEDVDSEPGNKDDRDEAINVKLDASTSLSCAGKIRVIFRKVV
jgi:hypothetical protein